MSELEEMFERWWAGELGVEEWTHAAHVKVCCYLVWHHTLAESYRLMKEGLHRFLKAEGIPNTEDRGYHETLTRFWCTLLFHRVRSGQFRDCGEAAAAMVEEFGNNSRAERAYYTFDVLKSRVARRTWVPPDIADAGWSGGGEVLEFDVEAGAGGGGDQDGAVKLAGD